MNPQARQDGIRPNALHVATGGGMGRGTVQAIEVALAAIGGLPGAILSGATDAGTAGERYAAHHAELAAAAGVRFERLMPTIGTHWNDVVKRRRGA